MAKICFPHYEKGEFASLADALKFLERETYSQYALCQIVKYNTCYRNHLRRHGVGGVIVRLIEEAPQLKGEKVLLHRLREWVAEEELADYDIQCYNINDKVTILGHTFNGLKDIQKHVELYGREEFDGLRCWSSTEVEPYDDVHIGHLYESYPIFDSSDLCDDRTYQNYIFRAAPITEADMKEALRISHGINFCMVHETIPEENLPILYYSGDGKYMFLATKTIELDRITPQWIDTLEENEIYVFGCRNSGRHFDGASNFALEHFGAVMGQREGRQGQSYAIPAIGSTIRLYEIRKSVDTFTKYATEHPELHFLVTHIGWGGGCCRVWEIAPMFRKASKLSNVSLPKEFWIELDKGSMAEVKQKLLVMYDALLGVVPKIVGKLKKKIVINGHEAVDLGLSVKWAACNVGAESPEEYGSYYAWGETEPKSDYTYDTYKYYDKNKKDYVDIGKDISCSKYDVARVQWGDNWRMPRLEEFRELIEKCYWQRTEVDGVEGCKVTGPNGNSIFFPAAGYYRYGKVLCFRGLFGYYWSATLFVYKNFQARSHFLFFTGGHCYRHQFHDRDSGFTVRPVIESKRSVFDLFRKMV